MTMTQTERNALADELETWASHNNGTRHAALMRRAASALRQSPERTDGPAVITLGADDFDEFERVMKTPAEPNAKLREAMNRKEPWCTPSPEGPRDEEIAALCLKLRRDGSSWAQPLFNKAADTIERLSPRPEIERAKDAVIEAAKRVSYAHCDEQRCLGTECYTCDLKRAVAALDASRPSEIEKR